MVSGPSRLYVYSAVTLALSVRPPASRTRMVSPTVRPTLSASGLLSATWPGPVGALPDSTVKRLPSLQFVPARSRTVVVRTNLPSRPTSPARPTITPSARVTPGMAASRSRSAVVSAASLPGLWTETPTSLRVSWPARVAAMESLTTQLPTVAVTPSAMAMSVSTTRPL